MPAPRSDAAQLAGAWLMAVAIVAGTVIAGRLIANYPYLLPNGLPGLVVYELAPGLLLAIATGAGLALTHHSAKPLGFATRLAILLIAALIAGVVSLLYEFGRVLYP